MAEKKKHKKRKQHTKNKAVEAPVAAAAQEQSDSVDNKADAKKADAKKAQADAKKAAKKKKEKKGKDGKPAKPNIFQRFIIYCKDVKSELQRVVWPTKRELINASLIVIGAIIFFGVLIAIIDNIVVIPLDWIASLGA